MGVLLKDESAQPEPNSRQDGPCLTDDMDILDWDVYVETPPPRAGGSIHVMLNYVGRSLPLTVPDPNKE
jgi:hypothetical protein